MIKKVYITEFEKENILKLHKKINEETGLSIGGVVLVLNKNYAVPNIKVTLIKGKEIKGQIDTKEDGSFKFEGLDSGNYIIKVENSNEGYNETTIDILLLDTDSLYNKIFISKEIKELEEIGVSVKKVTILDFKFTNNLGEPLSNVSYKLFKDEGNMIDTFISLNSNSTLTYTSQDILIKDNEPITFDKNKKDGFFYTDVSGICKANKDLIVVASTSGYIETKKTITFCLNNGNYKTNTKTIDNIQTITPSSDGLPKKTKNYENSNVFNISLLSPTINLKILTKENELVLPNVKIDIFKDKDKKTLIRSIETNQNGFGNYTLNVSDLELFNNKNETVKRVSLYFYIRKDGYKDMFKLENVRYGKEDDIIFNLSKVKPVPEIIPKPQKDLNIGQCRRFTKKYYRGLVSLIKRKKTIDKLGGDSAIEESRKKVEWCFLKYKDDYSKNMKNLINKLTNVPPKFDIFELRFTLEQQRGIYEESKGIELSQNIRNVIFKQSEKKIFLNNESKIIKNRLLFVYNTSNIKILKDNLLNESIELVNCGYNKILVKENFLKIMSIIKD